MKNNKRFLKELILFTVLPFAAPFIFDIPEYLMDIKMKLLIFISIAVLYFCFTYKSLLEKEKDKHNEWLQKSIRSAFTGAHEIIESKREALSHETEFNMIDLKKNIFPYDIHSQIYNICKEFKRVISTITQINNEFISATFIYRYTYKGCSENDSQWKWIGGREPISKGELNDFVKKEDTIFYHIINDNVHYIFGNKKEELSQQRCYYLGVRDKMYNNVGSVFSIKLAFGNNTDIFVEGIITITTYGKYLTDNMEIGYEPDTLRNMIIDEIFPYYRKLIETELGLLYIRHINK